MMDERYPPGMMDYDEGIEPGINLRDYFVIIMKHRGIVLATFLGVLLFTSIYAFSQKPVYYARAAVEIQPERLDIGEQVYRQTFWYSAMMIVQTQMEVARSRTVAEMVVSRLGPDRVAQLLGLEPNPERPWDVPGLAGMLLHRIKVRAREDTFIFDLGFDSPTPEGAAVLANTWAESLIDFNRESEVRMSRTTSEALEEQIKRLQKSIAEKEARLNQMAESAQIQVLDKQLNIAAQKLDQLNQQLLEVQKELTEKEANLRRIQNTPPASLPEIMNNPSIQDQQKACDKARQEYVEKSRIFKPDWPGLRQLKVKRDETCGQLEKAVQELHQRLIAQARGDLEATRSKERSIRQQYERTRREIDELNRKTTEYQTLKADLDNERNLLEKMIQRKQTAQLTEVGGIQFHLPMRIVEMAIPPKHPSRPNRMRLLAMGVILGLMGGVGLAFLLNLLDNKIRNHEIIERLTSYRFLTFIPDSTKEDDEHVVRNSFEFLTEYIAFLGKRENPPRVIMVTSAQPQEGKTFISSNLAITLATKRKRVLLIDFDIHRPNLHYIFKVQRQPGIPELLKMADRPDFSFFPRFHQGLVVVPCPKADHRQLSLMIDPDIVQRVFHETLRSFDYVIIDSAPVLSVPEAIRLSGVVDGIILVVRSDFTTTNALKLVKENLERIEARVLGVVLNMVNMMDRYSYYTYVYPYRYYYTYYRGGEATETDTKTVH